MRLSILSLTAILVPASLGAVLSKRACQATLNRATRIANQLQSHYYNAGAGQYNSGSLWTDANTIEDLHHLMLITGTTTYESVASTSNLGKHGSAADANSWASLINGSNDDSLWIVLMLWQIVDYKTAHGQDASNFEKSADEIYQMIDKQWDNTCGGGVWWSTAHTYKNAITNQLFLLTSAAGGLRTGSQQYKDNAAKTWKWLESSGMRNAQGLWNDGLDSSTCKNNGQTTWTYNQGVIASGLGALFALSGNTTLLDQAEITLDAVKAHLTSNNILKESCDDAAKGGAQCNHDQQMFKGLWTKHVARYLGYANNASRTAKYAAFLNSQESGVLHFGTNAAGDVGSVWYAPDAGGSVFQPEASDSGLAATIAAAQFGSECQ